MEKQRRLLAVALNQLSLEAGRRHFKVELELVDSRRLPVVRISAQLFALGVSPAIFDFSTTELTVRLYRHLGVVAAFGFITNAQRETPLLLLDSLGGINGIFALHSFLLETIILLQKTVSNLQVTRLHNLDSR